MNIDHLKAFVETVQLSSISKAADQLHLTQPAVSLQLQSLESSIGYQLLFRSNRGVQLTEYGKVFYSYAQSFLTLWDNLQNDLKNIQDGKTAALQVGTCPAIGQYALPCAIYLFKQKFPQIRLSVQSMASDTILNEVRDHTLQIGFLEGVPNLPDLAVHVVLQSDLLLVGAPANDLQAVTLGELPTLPLILTRENCDVRRSLKQNLTTYGMDENKLQPFLELDGLESVKSAVLSGHGLSFIPYLAIKKELFSGELKPVGIKDAKLEITFSMVWRKDEALSEQGEFFVNFIKTEGGQSFC
mgnify:FL=1